MEKAINHLKNNKSPGEGEIVTETIKAMGKFSVNAFYKLYSKIWHTGVWPKEWCESLYMPLHKKMLSDRLQKLQNNSAFVTCKQNSASYHKQTLKTFFTSTDSRRTDRIHARKGNKETYTKNKEINTKNKLICCT